MDIPVVERKFMRWLFFGTIGHRYTDIHKAIVYQTH